MSISLSILDYEPGLREEFRSPAGKARFLLKIMRLVRVGALEGVHIDLMRPPLIPGRFRFPVELMRWLYDKLHQETMVEIHLMTKNPYGIIRNFGRSIPRGERENLTFIIQREAYKSESEVLHDIRDIEALGYRVGISLDLPTPLSMLTERIVNNSSLVLLMTVPMGRGGQEYSPKATRRIRTFSRMFPEAFIKVDGGIRDTNIRLARDAGARSFVVGSFITRSERPEEAIRRLKEALSNVKRSGESSIKIFKG